MVCLGGFNNTRQEFEVGGASLATAGPSAAACMLLPVASDWVHSFGAVVCWLHWPRGGSLVVDALCS